MPKKAKKLKTPTKELQYLGEQIKAERNRCGLTQQELADQAGRGLRHLQGIESGIVNPSYAVLSSIVHRLAMSGNVLFFPDMPQVEAEVQHLLCKFAACTEDERQIILHTRTLYDANGQPHVCIDEYMKRRLQIKLIHTIAATD